MATVIGRVSHGYAGSSVSYPLWAMDSCHYFYCENELLKYPSFGLLLSCFGHDRAKNNSVLPCGLDLCSPLVRIVPGRLCFFTGL